MNVEEIIKTSKEIPLEPRTLIHMQLVHNKINETMNSALKPFEVSLQQFNVLRILRGQKGQPANLSTLNERMVTKMSNTTRLVDKLLIKGFVDRAVCPSNRRKVEIVITESGLKALEQMDASLEKAHEEIYQNFNTEDLEKLNELLDKF
ncbi:MarR family winged helix-turn-helix transcriptional regulator [Flagellimonas zhangzhouensis]|uniref:DNA-binding transcriptional regulator, MarR family n=1 Tax=Flagellimonas zhangzhouensis TaxID=1073328 RepID=A0A1H2Z004_9FLAO|nr:MarR family transcriptional regulator [Allomuricauda zhangzhouensis]SDR04304.1 DNA-binding transcriptional regulator, MarR family [Allomuricauda zhangzhouensis]SDX10645.1 DNA-binding transcriptional regulator, MarR family [Allomuricauda zhangzhouensis]